MHKIEAFLADFEAVAHSFDKGLEVNVEMSLGRVSGTAYQELLVRAYAPSYAGRPQETVALVKGKDKSEALTNLTSALRAKYPAPGQVAYASNQQKQQLLSLINHPLFPVHQKSAVLLNINVLSETAIENKMAAIRAQLLTAEEKLGQFVVKGEAEIINPSQPGQAA